MHTKREREHWPAAGHWWAAREQQFPSADAGQSESYPPGERNTGTRSPHFSCPGGETYNEDWWIPKAMLWNLLQQNVSTEIQYNMTVKSVRSQKQCSAIFSTEIQYNMTAKTAGSQKQCFANSMFYIHIPSSFGEYVFPVLQFFTAWLLSPKRRGD